MENQNDSLFKRAADALVDQDPIVKRVLEHYASNKNAAPIDCADVKHFWNKVSEKATELHNQKA